MESVLIVLGVGLAALVLSGVRIAQEYQRAVVFRLGRFHSVRGPGLYYNIPLIEWQKRVDMRTVTVKVNAVLWYRVTEPFKAILEVANFRDAVYQVALTSLRNIIGQHMLDEVLKERDQINQQLRAIVDQATDPWGVQVEMVEMKDVEIPQG